MCGTGELPDLWDKCYDKVALLVGNKKYHKSELLLNTPDRDAQDLAGVLQSAGFKVVSLIDLSKREMEKVCVHMVWEVCEVCVCVHGVGGVCVGILNI